MPATSPTHYLTPPSTAKYSKRKILLNHKNNNKKMKKNKTIIILLSVLAVAMYTVAVINFCLGDVLNGIATCSWRAPTR